MANGGRRENGKNSRCISLNLFPVTHLIAINFTTNILRAPFCNVSGFISVDVMAFKLSYVCLCDGKRPS